MMISCLIIFMDEFLFLVNMDYQLEVTLVPGCPEPKQLLGEQLIVPNHFTLSSSISYVFLSEYWFNYFVYQLCNN
jgi:hypothetical protein